MRPLGITVYEDKIVQLGLKKIIYPELLRRQKDASPDLPGFALVERCPISFSFTVEGPQIQNLLAMTPHFWRITREGAQRLAALSCLTDWASAVLCVYRPV